MVKPSIISFSSWPESLRKKALFCPSPSIIHSAGPFSDRIVKCLSSAFQNKFVFPVLEYVPSATRTVSPSDAALIPS